MKWHKRNNDDLDEDLGVKKKNKNKEIKREKKKRLRQRKKWWENGRKMIIKSKSA